VLNKYGDYMYVCAKCGKEIKKIYEVRCPYCGYRIILKKRPEFEKAVKAV